MIGGLFRGISFKNVNGSCLINCTLNSVLNSYEIVKKLYELLPHNISLNMPFNKILNIDTKYKNISTVYKYLLAAFLQDYLHNIKPMDRDKILFAALNDDNIKINRCNTLQEAASILQKLYKDFNHNLEAQTRTFLLLETNLAYILHIQFSRVLTFHKYLNEVLKHYKDIYIILNTTEEQFKMTVSLNTEECDVIRGMLKAALTSTNEYLCTDMILYKGNDTNLIKYSHVVYYNVLDNTLIDNDSVNITDISSFLPPKKCKDFVEYVKKKQTHTIYVPCILHYQKIQNDAQKIGFIGTIKDYNLKRNDRIQFIKDVINEYSEPWYIEKRDKYLDYLNKI